MDDSVAEGEAEKTASCEAEQGKEETPMEEDKGQEDLPLSQPTL